MKKKLSSGGSLKTSPKDRNESLHWKILQSLSSVITWVFDMVMVFVMVKLLLPASLLMNFFQLGYQERHFPCFSTRRCEGSAVLSTKPSVSGRLQRSQVQRKKKSKSPRLVFVNDNGELLSKSQAHPRVHALSGAAR